SRSVLKVVGADTTTNLQSARGGTLPGKRPSFLSSVESKPEEQQSSKSLWLWPKRAHGEHRCTNSYRLASIERRAVAQGSMIKARWPAIEWSNESHNEALSCIQRVYPRGNCTPAGIDARLPIFPCQWLNLLPLQE